MLSMYFRTDTTIGHWNRSQFGGRTPIPLGEDIYGWDLVLGTSPGLGEPHISTGEFGSALSSHLWKTAVPPIEEKMVREILRLLRLSSRFMKMVYVLDKKYLALGVSDRRWERMNDWGLKNGVFNAGPARGGRLCVGNYY